MAFATEHAGESVGQGATPPPSYEAAVAVNASAIAAGEAEPVQPPRNNRRRWRGRRGGPRRRRNYPGQSRGGPPTVKITLEFPLETPEEQVNLLI